MRLSDFSKSPIDIFNKSIVTETKPFFVFKRKKKIYEAIKISLLHKPGGENPFEWGRWMRKWNFSDCDGFSTVIDRPNLQRTQTSKVIYAC